MPLAETCPARVVEKKRTRTARCDSGDQPFGQGDLDGVAVLIEDVQSGLRHVARSGLAHGNLLGHQFKARHLCRSPMTEKMHRDIPLLPYPPGTTRGLLQGVDVE